MNIAWWPDGRAAKAIGLAAASRFPDLGQLAHALSTTARATHEAALTFDGPFAGAMTEILTIFDESTTGGFRVKKVVVRNLGKFDGDMT